MTPEKQQALEKHIQAIAKILYEDTPPEKLTSLGGIEEAVRSQMQKHVMPEVGFFYQNSYRHKRRVSTKTKKYSGRIANNKEASRTIGSTSKQSNESLSGSLLSTGKCQCQL